MYELSVYNAFLNEPNARFISILYFSMSYTVFPYFDKNSWGVDIIHFSFASALIL